MIKLFVRGLPAVATEESVSSLFGTYGTVRGLTLHKDLFSGRARGTALIEMEGHEARAAMDGLDGSEFEGRTIYVSKDKGPRGRGGRRRR